MSAVDFSAVLEAHEGCRMNDSRDGHHESSGLTGVDVWSCDLLVPFTETLEEAERAHLAAALDVAVDVWLTGIEAREAVRIAVCRSGAVDHDGATSPGALEYQATEAVLTALREAR